LQSINFKRISKPACLQVFSNTKNLYIIVTSSLGLCASYNYNIFRTIDPLLKPDDELVLIGQKGYLHYKEKSYKHYDDFVNLMDACTFDNVKKLRHFFFHIYRTRTYQSVTMVYTTYKNSLSFLPTVKRLLPYDMGALGITAETQPAYKPIFDPDPKQVLALILPHYIDASVFNKLLESELSEQCSRRNAMETATDSADKITDSLKIVYNKKRQNAITQEITEVVAGANAAKGVGSR
jgi:F-type H+-transporting ATPase subunit gamma